MRILIIQTAYMGDVVLTIPLLEAVRNRYRDAHIALMLIPYTKNILEGHPALDEIITYDKKSAERGFLSFIDKVMQIRRKKYDWALLPHRSFRSALLAFLAGIPRRTGFSSSQGALFLTELRGYQKGQHDLERNLSLLGEVQKRGWDNRIPVSEADKNFVDNLFLRNRIQDSDRVVAIAPGSAWPTKRWPVERYSELSERLLRAGCRIIIVGGKDDISLGNFIEQDIDPGAGEGLVNIIGQTSLKKLAAIISRSDLLISNDSGTIHIAAAVQTPVVAIFGPTTEELGFFPYGDIHKVLEKPMYCRPCGKHGGLRCPRGTHECMNAITVEEVFTAVCSQMRIDT